MCKGYAVKRYKIFESITGGKPLMKKLGRQRKLKRKEKNITPGYWLMEIPKNNYWPEVDTCFLKQRINRPIPKGKEQSYYLNSTLTSKKLTTFL